MKKALIYTLLVLVIGCMVGFTTRQAKTDNAVTGVVLDIFMPSVAYADSDTVGGYIPKPPPIK